MCLLTSFVVLTRLVIQYGDPTLVNCLCQPGLVGACSVWFIISCFACFAVVTSVGNLGICRQLHKQVENPQRKLVHRGPSYRWGCWLFLLVCFRIGEASNPGPDPQDEWTFGLCNPSGLTSKTDHAARLPGSVWVCCETHLTQPGVAQLKQGLRVLQSHHKYVVPGYPCAPRTSTDVGTFSGVLMLSQYPARALAHQFPPDLYKTSRLQVAGVCVGQTWVQVGMLYGVPKSVAHQQAKYQTECLLETLVDRLAWQTQGPRIICGDFNYQPYELHQLSRLRAMGFREVQDIALDKWGKLPRPTGRGDRRIDQIWLSPELQHVLSDFQVEEGWWADHAVLQCTFQSSHTAFEIDHWVMPMPLPWPAQHENWHIHQGYDPNIDPSTAYAQMWHCIEHSALDALSSSKYQVSSQQCGRGITLDTLKRKPSISPCKVGREGDDQPQYMGVSLQHNRWFRQLRRLQALARNVHKQGVTSHQVEQRYHLWHSIRNSVGFAGGFARWWQTEKLAPNFPNGLPLVLPQESELHLMCESFRVRLRQFETSLEQKRKGSARAKRRSDLSYVFRDCQKEKPPLVDALIQTNYGTIESVNPDDQSLVFTEPVQFNQHDPIIGQGKLIAAIHSEHDQLWVEDTSGLSPGDCIVQERAITTDQAILHEFHKVWSDRWVKLRHLDNEQWQKISGFIRQAVAPIEWNMPQWTGDQVSKLIATKKKSSATGADGVSRRDLLSMPPHVHSIFADMFNAIESTNAWPKQLTVGIVSSLDKMKGGGTVDSYRPITIYPILYRVWSSHRARQALRILTHHLPSSVRGGVPGKQARAVWFEISQLLEGAHFGNESWQGVMLDIRRAFNALPRQPIWAILDALNFPPQLTKTWGSFVAQQVRRFRVRQSTGCEIPSCVGLPEGCALSVMGMILIDWVFDLWLHAHWTIPKQLYLYIDDWHVAFSDSHEHSDLLRHIRNFSDQLDVEIDDSKSFAWGAHAQDRKILKSGELDVTLAARDLGAHQNFSLKSGNRVVTDRIKMMQPLWSKLRGSVAPYRSKEVAIRQMAWPRSLHASSVVHLGKQHFVSLRTGAVRSLRADKIGANPGLHLATNTCLLDPEFWCIYQTVKEARELGNILQMSHMLSMIGGGIRVPPNGPAMVLACRLQTLGWAVLPTGAVQDALGSFCCLSVHWDEVHFRLVSAWPKVLATFVSHRKSFAGIENADLPELSRALKLFSEADRIFLRSGLDGTLYTDKTKTKEQRGHNSKCIYCQADDSFAHRLWKCPRFETARIGFRWQHLLQQLPACLVNHGWPVKMTSQIRLMQHFRDLPSPVFTIPDSLPIKCIDLFTDGTCAFPREPSIRYASWAVTMALTDGATLDHAVLGCGHLSGLIQTSFRSELTALIVALQVVQKKGVRARIWTDCQAVLNKYHKVSRGWTPSCNSSHSDLWTQVVDIFRALPVGIVSCGKVVSHGDCNQTTSGIEDWCFWHNQLADAAAGSFNQRRSEQFWVDWQRAATDLVFYRQVHEDILLVILKVGQLEANFLGKKLQGANEAHPGVRHSGGPDPARIAGDGHVPLEWKWSEKLSKRCLLSNLMPLHRWWTTVVVPMFATERYEWISGIQMYIDFCFAVNGQGPIMLHGRWQEWNDQVWQLHATTTFARRIKMFLTLWKAYITDNHLVVPAVLRRPRSAGVAFWCQCYQLPWPSERLLEVDRILLQINGRQLPTLANVQHSSFLDIPKGNVLPIE